MQRKLSRSLSGIESKTPEMNLEREKQLEIYEWEWVVVQQKHKPEDDDNVRMSNVLLKYEWKLYSIVQIQSVQSLKALQGNKLFLQSV